MTDLKKDPTLKDFQEYEINVCRKRGFEDHDRGELFAHLLEEVGELARSARKIEEGKETKENFGYEAADVLIFLVHLCNKYDIDLEAAFRAKEEINKNRTWE